MALPAASAAVTAPAIDGTVPSPVLPKPTDRSSTHGLAAASMGYVLWKNIYPVPPSPYDALPRIFVGLLVVAALWHVVRGRVSHREYRAGLVVEAPEAS